MRWEYKSIVIKISSFSKMDAQNKQIEDQLNQLGMLGWELVNYIMMGVQYRAIFKREK